MPLNYPLNRRLRMALLGGGGTGFIGKVHRTAALLDGRVDLVSGAFSSNLDRSRDTAVDFAVDSARAFDSFENLLDDELNRPAEERVDFVSIATPNWLHFPMAKATLQAGFNVMCDKPMTVNLAQAEELVDLVEQSGAVFGLTHNYTGYPLIRQAREMIAAGELGEIKAVRVNYIQGWMRGVTPGDTPARGAWKDDPLKNGPAATMGDVGSHAFNLASFVTGLEPAEVSATVRTFAPGRQLDDYGHALVRFTNDALCMVTVSQVTHGRLNDLSIEVDGEKASLAWRQETPNVLTLGQFGEPTRIYDRHPAAAYTNESGRTACRLPAGHPEAFFEAFANVYSAACDDMVKRATGQLFDSEDTLYPNVRDGLAGVRFIEQTIASSQARGEWLPLSQG
jgi:predicted dehydrogenase